MSQRRYSHSPRKSTVSGQAASLTVQAGEALTDASQPDSAATTGETQIVDCNGCGITVGYEFVGGDWTITLMYTETGEPIVGALVSVA